VQFALRADNVGEYISHSTWRDRQSFIDWTQSEAFTAGHRQGPDGCPAGPPQIGLYEAVIVQTPALISFRDVTHACPPPSASKMSSFWAVLSPDRSSSTAMITSAPRRTLERLLISDRSP
jgi:hypothetical protein